MNSGDGDSLVMAPLLNSLPLLPNPVLDGLMAPLPPLPPILPMPDNLDGFDPLAAPFPGVNLPNLPIGNQNFLPLLPQFLNPQNDANSNPLPSNNFSDNMELMDSLLKEMFKMYRSKDEYGTRFNHAYTLLSAELDRVWSALYEQWKPIVDMSHQFVPLMSGIGEPVRLTTKIRIPESKDPRCNYIGRIIGPNGLTIRKLETEINCRILIRGKGSVKDPEREARLAERPGYEHLLEPLHVVLIATRSSQEKCKKTLKLGTKRIKSLFTPAFDQLKRSQLIQLAIINGKPVRN